MTPEEKAVLDAAMAWFGDSFREHSMSAYRGEVPVAKLKSAIVNLATSRVTPEQEQAFKAKLRAERKARQDVAEAGDGLPQGLYEKWYDDVVKESDARAKVAEMTAEQRRKYTGRDDV